MAIQLEQRIDVRRIGPTTWRITGFIGRGIYFYAEAAGEGPSLSANNEFRMADVGSWRAVDNNRHLVIGHSGRVVVAPKPDGKPGEVNVTFENVRVVI